VVEEVRKLFGSLQGTSVDGEEQPELRLTIRGRSPRPKMKLDR
jgi:hypothetical protein